MAAAAEVYRPRGEDREEGGRLIPHVALGMTIGLLHRAGVESTRSRPGMVPEPGENPGRRGQPARSTRRRHAQDARGPGRRPARAVTGEGIGRQSPKVDGERHIVGEVRGALPPAWPFRGGSVLPGCIQSDHGPAGGPQAPSAAADRAKDPLLGSVVRRPCQVAGLRGRHPGLLPFINASHEGHRAQPADGPNTRTPNENQGGGIRLGLATDGAVAAPPRAAAGVRPPPATRTAHRPTTRPSVMEFYCLACQSPRLDSPRD